MSRNNWTDDKLLSRLTENKTDKSRWDSISVLRKRPSDELFAKCVALTQSTNPKIRIIGIDVLAQFGLPPRPFLNETLKLYFELLEVETDRDVLAALMHSIGHCNEGLNKEQIEKICSYAYSDDTSVRKGLVFALLGVDNLTAIETLIKLSSDKLSQVRSWATFGLGTLINRNSKGIREALWKRVSDKHQETKYEAMVGLAKRKDKRINDFIRQEMIGGAFGSLLFEAILETKDKKFLPLLNQHLTAIHDQEGINPAWEQDLRDCIDELAKLKDTKQTTA